MTKSTFRRVWVVCMLATVVAGRASAQTKIGSNPATLDPSALLELESTSKGLLLPRLTIAQRDAITGPAKGLTIFVTSDSTLQVNMGTPAVPLWKRVSTTDSLGAQTRGWNLTGNAGTNSGQNFLGTTDNKSLRFRTNNVERMAVDSNGSIAFGTGKPLSASGVNIDVTNNNPPYLGSGFRDTGLVVKSNQFGIKAYNNSWAYRGAALISQPIDGGFGYGMPAIKSSGIYNYNEHGQGSDLSYGIYSHHRIGGGSSVGVGIGAFADLGGGSSLKVGLSARANGYATNDHYAIVASGGDIYLGSTNAAMPVGPGADSFSVVFGTNNLTTTYLYSTRISGVNNYVSAAGDTIGFKAPASAASITYTLPAASPTTANKVLTSTPAGIMSWTDPSTFGGNTGWATTGNALTGSEVFGSTNYKNINFITNGAQRMVLDTFGRLGIGTTNPGSLLGVTGSVGLNQSYGVNFTPSMNSNQYYGNMFGLNLSPNFSGSQYQQYVAGQYTSFGYGGANVVAGEMSYITSNGGNNIVASKFGNVYHGSGGSDNLLQGAWFLAYNQSGGTVNNMSGVRGEAYNQSSSANTTTLTGLAGAAYQQIGGTVGSIYGVQATASVNSGAITSSAMGGSFDVSASGTSGIIPSVYGLKTLASIGSGTTATDMYGLHINAINGGTVTNYRGIYMASVPPVSGIGRAIEYAGIAPFVVNGNGSVGIGTTTPVTNAMLAVKDGHVQSQITTAPGANLNANAGTGRSGIVANATDVAGTLTITTGSGAWAAGPQMAVTFNKPYAVAPIVTLTSVTAGQGAVDAYVTATTTGFTINFTNAATSARNYVYNYQVIETQTNNGLVSTTGGVIITGQN